MCVVYAIGLQTWTHRRGDLLEVHIQNDSKSSTRNRFPAHQHLASTHLPPPIHSPTYSLHNPHTSTTMIHQPSHPPVNDHPTEQLVNAPNPLRACSSLRFSRIMSKLYPVSRSMVSSCAARRWRNGTGVIQNELWASIRRVGRSPSKMVGIESWAFSFAELSAAERFE